MRPAAIALAVCLAVSAAFAAESGRAEGSVTIDKNKVALGYAYALGRQRNEITKRKDDVKVVLTDKALAADVDLNEIDATLPQDTYALIFNVASNNKITHVAVMHPKGSYDAGYLEDMPDFHFKNANGGRGVIAGRLSSARVQTNTMTFNVDVDFNAPVK